MAAAAIPLIAGTVGLSVYQAERQASAHRKALREQRRVQEEQAAKLGAEQRRAATEQRMKNQKAPDVTSLLSTAAEQANTGAAGTILTGPLGTDQRRRLGGASFLG